MGPGAPQKNYVTRTPINLEPGWLAKLYFLFPLQRFFLIRLYIPVMKKLKRLLNQEFFKTVFAL
jgi:hypothetical protein